MKLKLIMLLAAVAAGGIVAGTMIDGDSALLGRLMGARANRVAIAYVPPKDPQFTRMYDLLRSQQVLERFRDYLGVVRLPETLTLKFDQCGVSNAWYEPADRTVTVCYEYVAEVVQSAPTETTPEGVSRMDAIVGPTTEVFLHEAAHALFDMLNVPIFGREEDAADQFAAYLLLRLDPEEAKRAINGTAYMYSAQAKAAQTFEMAQFADVHGTPAQRLYNLLCIAYGGDPKLFVDVVAKGFLPQWRAESCQDEYAQVDAAFTRLLGRHVDPHRSRKLKGRRWLPFEGTVFDIGQPGEAQPLQPPPAPAP